MNKLCALLLLQFSASAQAGSYVPLTVEDAVGTIDVVAEGVVTDGYYDVVLLTDGTPVPVTKYRVEVTQPFTGIDAGEFVDVVFPGGWSASGRFVHVDDVPKIEMGELVLVTGTRTSVNRDAVALFDWDRGLLRLRQAQEGAWLTSNAQGTFITGFDSWATRRLVAPAECAADGVDTDGLGETSDEAELERQYELDRLGFGAPAVGIEVAPEVLALPWDEAVSSWVEMLRIAGLPMESKADE